MHRQGEVDHGVSLQTGPTLHLQTQPGCSGALQRAQHRPADHGEKHVRTETQMTAVEPKAQTDEKRLPPEPLGTSGGRQRLVRGPRGGADGGRGSQALGLGLQRELGPQRGHGGLQTAGAGLRCKSLSGKRHLL